MLLVSFVLLYLAIKKQFEPLLLLPIAFGMFLANLPLAGLMNEADHWYQSGVLRIMYMGVKSSLFPCLIFMAVGAMTDFGPLIANPVSLLLGAAAQFGIYVAFALANATGLVHTVGECCSDRYHRRRRRPDRDLYRKQPGSGSW
ncbi:MAG: sodium ion-translocating decarboxylase subunit beta [Pilosibacter sp.]